MTSLNFSSFTVRLSGQRPPQHRAYSFCVCWLFVSLNTVCTICAIPFFLLHIGCVYLGSPLLLGSVTLVGFPLFIFLSFVGLWLVWNKKVCIVFCFLPLNPNTVPNSVATADNNASVSVSFSLPFILQAAV